MQTQYGFRDRFPANSSWSVLVVVVCVGLCLCLNIVLLLRGHRVVYLHSRWKESRNNPVSLSTYGEGSVVLLTWFCASCHKLSGTVCSDPLAEGVFGVCGILAALNGVEFGAAARKMNDWKLHRQQGRQGGRAGRAGRRWPKGLRTMWPAVRVLGSFSGCWLQRWQQPSFSTLAAVATGRSH